MILIILKNSIPTLYLSLAEYQSSYYSQKSRLSVLLKTLHATAVSCTQTETEHVTRVQTLHIPRH